MMEQKFIIPPVKILKEIERERPRTRLTELTALGGEENAASIMIAFTGDSLHFPRMSSINKIMKEQYVKRELKGLLVCGQCKRALLGEIKKVKLKSGVVKEEIYYHCTKDHYFADKSGNIISKKFVDYKNSVISEDIAYVEDEGDKITEIITHKKGEPVKRQ